MVRQVDPVEERRARTWRREGEQDFSERLPASAHDPPGRRIDLLELYPDADLLEDPNRHRKVAPGIATELAPGNGHVKTLRIPSLGQELFRLGGIDHYGYLCCAHRLDEAGAGPRPGGPPPYRPHRA